ncbi:TLD domain-containing protein 1 [Arapaima gigas]
MHMEHRKQFLPTAVSSAMGNTDSVPLQQRRSRFRPHELTPLDGAFDRLHEAAGAAAAGHAGKLLSLDALKACTEDMASASMTSRLFEAMHSVDAGTAVDPRGGVTRDQLFIFLSDVLRGSVVDHVPLVVAMSGGATEGLVGSVQITEFLEDLLSAVVQTLIRRGQLQGWKPECMGDSDRGVKLLAEQLRSELQHTDEQKCSLHCVENWLSRTPSVSLYLEYLTIEVLGVRLPSRPPLVLLPLCRDTPWRELRSLVDLPLLLFLAPQLPGGQSTPWRLLFSTQLHGESFTRLVGSCVRRGPTLLLLRDTHGYMFGGFVSCSWEIKPQFQGDSRCFLFTVSPSLRVYTYTGYNHHYMYLNQGQRTMPNGLVSLTLYAVSLLFPSEWLHGFVHGLQGMGGHHNYFGLWLDSDFGHGHSWARPRCITYNSPQLSAEENFTLDSLEVWGVGEPPESQEQTLGKKSVLDGDPESQAIMEMAGKTLHSQGLREPEEGEEP